MERKETSDLAIGRRSFLNRAGRLAVTVGAVSGRFGPTDSWAQPAAQVSHPASARVVERLRSSFTFQISVDVGTLEQGLVVAGAAVAGGIS
ncbi:MAG: hypothetical protein ABI211_18875, partial [Vicinamibacterales bacterium]